jgi:plasmid stabilization system protein ParE
MAAMNLNLAVKEVRRKLRENPYRRPLVHDPYLADKGYHSIAVKNYLLFYTIDENNKIVRLHRFMHKTRDWMTILSGK